MVMPGLMDGMGGFNYTAIQVTFDNTGIKQELRPRLFPLMVKLINVIQSERARRKKNAG